MRVLLLCFEPVLPLPVEDEPVPANVESVEPVWPLVEPVLALVPLPLVPAAEVPLPVDENVSEELRPVGVGLCSVFCEELARDESVALDWPLVLPVLEPVVELPLPVRDEPVDAVMEPELEGEDDWPCWEFHWPDCSVLAVVPEVPLDVPATEPDVWFCCELHWSELAVVPVVPVAPVPVAPVASLEVDAELDPQKPPEVPAVVLVPDVALVAGVVEVFWSTVADVSVVVPELYTPVVVDGYVLVVAVVSVAGDRVV